MSKNKPQQEHETVLFVRPERSALSLAKRLGAVFREFSNNFLSQFSRDPIERCRWRRFPSSLSSRSDKPKDRLARAGQEEVVFLLKEKGYRVLQQNIRFSGLGELDIVALSGRTLVFMEVKTRRGVEHGRPDEAVIAAKQRRQIAMAKEFMNICRISNVPVRFDIVSVLWPERKTPTIDHFDNAFRENDFTFP